jgi:hypothetical protein
MSDDRFLERLRSDAAALRYEPDDVTLSRIRARVRAAIQRPTVMDILANWMRPLAASLAAIAAVAVIAMTSLGTSDDISTLGNGSVEISVGGDTFSVGR